MAKSNHYINNPDFLAALVKFHADCAEAKKENREEPPIPLSLIHI